ncbi:Polypeptide N-acetylgalactosaminyltransferase-like 6 [Acipenser ruthenus]|uniref:Polypeptide N-acetylgalactosaminyltransferase-like 6 n=1 Tax=Acipenser ruthenus TaxID=7906 RepID=A0A444U4Y0_ACIRT|nr:Polypeptide N-acetylgalactosaminyltransferase-like 6 [Acipenser ruthenus]
MLQDMFKMVLWYLYANLDDPVSPMPEEKVPYVRGRKGEHGKPYPLTEEECDDSTYRENGFNIYVSNNIALDRSLPDIRHPKSVLFIPSNPQIRNNLEEGTSFLIRPADLVLLLSEGVEA